MIGLVLGKFLPPHAGHVHLCEVAQRMCDELVIVVDDGGSASVGSAAAGQRGLIDGVPGPIAVQQRVAWMRELFPSARVEVVHDMPQTPDAHPQFWRVWRDALPRADRVFTGDAYGERLAAELGAQWIRVDRATLPISGTLVRDDPRTAWAYLPRSVRAHYARRISVFGPESTGKSTLAEALARELQTTCVPEFARTYLEAHPLTADAMPVIRDGQAALEDSLARDCNRTLICDTDPLLTSVWSETLYGAPLPTTRRYDLTLLCDVDLPWVADAVRYLPDDRAGFFARCEAALQRAERRYVVIRGRDRLRAALEAIA